VYLLHLVHAKNAQVCWFVNMFFFRFPPNHEAPDLYLVLTDERFLNDLLLAGLFPSNSAHLFWKRDLESYQYLEAYSHQWKALSPSTVGNTSMYPDLMDSSGVRQLTPLFTLVRMYLVP
jgi:hypothetical protein